jgi:hypothetical protein
MAASSRPPKSRRSESRKADKEPHAEFASGCPGHRSAVGTLYVGTLKGAGRSYPQTFIDAFTKVGFAELYRSEGPSIAAIC